MTRYLAIIFAALLTPAVPAADLAKEQRWADQIVDDLFDGQVVWLRAGNTRFLGLYTTGPAPRRGGVLLVHGVGAHPDWPQVINPLRVGLAARGWDTLSIQMPVLANDAPMADYAPLFDEVAPRIDAALRHFRSRGMAPIVLIGHSLGAAMSSYYLAAGEPGPLRGFAGIGMSAGGTPVMNNAIALRQIRLPVLDLYGSEDLPGVLQSATQRATAAAGNPEYRQQQLAGADHFFNDYEEALVAAIASWLDELSR